MIVRTQFSDLFLVDMLPAIDQVIYDRYNRYAPQYTKIFRMMSSERSIEQTTEITGLGFFNQVNEGGNVRYDEPLQGYDKTYTHGQWASGFKSTRVAIDDDKFGFIKRLGQELGNSASETIEVDAASDLNNGFSGSFLGPDGVALFSTSHPLRGGGVQSNRLTIAADLDVPNLELALTQCRKWVNHRGHKKRIPMTRLVHGADLEFAAAELLTGTMRSDTGNHTINAFKHRSGMSSFSDHFLYDYLTDPDTWFIAADPEDTELRYYWREKPNTVHDIDFDSRSVKTAMWYRNSHGWSGYLGWFGSPGA
jgi:phage major head subunit gpT-like protein